MRRRRASVTLAVSALALATCVGLWLWSCEKEAEEDDLAARHRPRRTLNHKMCQPRAFRFVCAYSRDPLECTLADLIESRVSADDIVRLAGGEPRPSDVDGALRRLFPALEGVRLTDGGGGAPPGESSVTFEYLNFEPYEIDLPVDWRADPYGNRSWAQNYQSLRWLATVADGELDAGAQMLLQWVDEVLFRDPPLYWTWRDNTIGWRLRAVRGFLGRLAARGAVDRRVAVAAARVVLTHVYALATEPCYSSHDNHGMMQDVELLSTLQALRLRDADQLWQRAKERALEHIRWSVTEDGVHVENSPMYHVVYLRLVSDVAAALGAGGRAPPPEVEAARSGMLAAAMHLLQPNLTLPQFGDTENDVVRIPLTARSKEAREAGRTDPRILDELDWVLTRGKRGTEPAQLDRVFEYGGYAAFRQAWSAEDPNAIIAGHMTCNRLGRGHYHRDEGSFEIYGYGTELVVDTGKYSYEYEDPFVLHQKGVFGHNVLVVDDSDYKPAGTPRIVAHAIGPQVSWAQCAHSNYRSRGIRSQVRTFAYARPDAFVVIDHVRASGRHEYAQQFLLHPRLSQVQAIDRRTVVARSPDGGPSLVLVAGEAPAAIELHRGEKQGDRLRGWYYPSWRVARPATQVVFRYQRGDEELTLPVVLKISSPGAEPAVPTNVRHGEEEGAVAVSWTVRGAPAHLEVPAP